GKRSGGYPESRARIHREEHGDCILRLSCRLRCLSSSEASPQTAESCRVSSQHSRWLTSLIDAFHTTVKRRLGSQRRLSAPSGDIALQGTHRLIQRRHGELAKGVRSALPPRYLAFEEVDV